MPASPDYPELDAARSRWRHDPGPGALDGRTLLVTGAGSGIGAVTAKTFACYGANIVLLGRRRAPLEAVFDWIEAATATRPVIVPCDLETLDESGAEALHDAVATTYGALHGIVHNASLLGPRVPIAHLAPHEWRRVMKVNAEAPFLLNRGLASLLEAAPSASIVSVSSSVGRRGRAYWGAYAVSKFALEGLTQVLADEYAASGRIRVNSVNPGATRTAMRATAYPAEDPATLPAPEQHMDLFLYLAGDASAGVTGRQFDCRTWRGPDDQGEPGSG
jgi:NAD(P)-dependent dehydrogenase (short-subunit alcohol dehydrogenase family)